METIQLHVEARNAGKKGMARSLRRAGKVPAVLYGPGREPQPLAVAAKELRARAEGHEGRQLIELEWKESGAGRALAVLKEVQRHPVTGAILHADFYAVDLSRKITVEVPLQFAGKAPGVELGGILQPVRRELEVRCLPMNIPDAIKVDVSELGIHDAIHVSELKLPEGVEVVYDQDFTIVTVLPPAVEEVPVAAVAAEGAPAAEGAAPGEAEPGEGGSE